MDEMKRKIHRVFVVDHMCAFPFGHNPYSVQAFSNGFRRYVSEVIPLVPKLYEKHNRDYPFHCVLNYPYNWCVESRFTQHPFVKRILLGGNLRSKISNWISHTEIAMNRLIRPVLSVDAQEKLTLQTWFKIMAKFDIGPSDLLFLPSADFYGCFTLLKAIATMGPTGAPSVHLRFIGVMEHAAMQPNPQQRLFKEICRSIDSNYSVTISTEIPSYAAEIQTRTGLRVDYMPHPVVGSRLSSVDQSKFTVSVLGTGRKDKGFLQISKIARKVDDNVKFLVQRMRREDCDFSQVYEKELEENPRIDLLPEILNKEEMVEAIRQSDLLVFPYDEDVYKSRSSGIYFEGLSYCRPVLVSKGTGLEEHVKRYQNGIAARGAQEFADQIAKFASGQCRISQEQLSRARALYADDFEKALLGVLSS